MVTGLFLLPWYAYLWVNVGNKSKTVMVVMGFCKIIFKFIVTLAISPPYNDGHILAKGRRVTVRSLRRYKSLAQLQWKYPFGKKQCWRWKKRRRILVSVHQSCEPLPTKNSVSLMFCGTGQNGSLSEKRLRDSWNNSTQFNLNRDRRHLTWYNMTTISGVFLTGKET